MSNGDDKNEGNEKTMALDVDDYLTKDKGRPEKTAAFNPEELFGPSDEEEAETTGAMSVDDMRAAGLYEEDEASSGEPDLPADGEEATMMLTADVADKLGMGDDDAAEPEPGPPPALAVEQGNDRGRVFDIVGEEVLVGRGLQSNIVLNDATVSRKHFKLVRSQDGYLLVDLGSGNGTRVDGERLAEVLLKDGMSINVGQTVMVWKAPVAVAAAAPPPSFDDDDDGSEATVALNLDDVDAASMGAGKAASTVPEIDAEADESTRIGEMASMEVDPDWAARAGQEAPAGVQTEHVDRDVIADPAAAGGKGKLIAIIGIAVVLLGGLVGGGIALFGGDDEEEAAADEEPKKTVFDEDWDDEEGEEEDEDDEGEEDDDSKGDPSLASRRAEIEALDGAARAIEGKRFSKATKLLARLDEKSPYVQQLLGLAKTGQSELALTKARLLLDAKETPTALSTIASGLKADAEDAELLALKKALTAPPDEKDEGKNATKEIKSALDAYGSGDFMGAVDGFDMVSNGEFAAAAKRQAVRLALAVTKFETFFTTVDSLASEGKTDGAIEQLSKARKVDASISGAFERKVNAKLATQYATMAKKAAEGGQPAKAAFGARMALVLDPELADAKTIMDELLGKVDGWLEDAEKAKGDDAAGAVDSLARVIRVLPEDDERRAKARKLLGEITGK